MLRPRNSRNEEDILSTMQISTRVMKATTEKSTRSSDIGDTRGGKQMVIGNKIDRPMRATRSVSLPPDLELVEKTSRTLFWFIPANRRPNQRGAMPIRLHDDRKGKESCPAPTSMNHQIPESLATQWTRLESPLPDDASYTGIDENEERDGELVGIEFINSILFDEAEDFTSQQELESY